MSEVIALMLLIGAALVVVIAVLCRAAGRECWFRVDADGTLTLVRGHTDQFGTFVET